MSGVSQAIVGMSAQSTAGSAGGASESRSRQAVLRLAALFTTRPGPAERVAADERTCGLDRQRLR